MDMDWSGDGYSDVMARHQNGDLCLFRGSGNNGFGSAHPDGPSLCGSGQRVGTGWQGSTSIFRAGDWSGDGCHDTLARNNAGQLLLFYGSCGTTTSTFFGSGGSVIGSGWNAFNWLFVPGDFSGDGFMDVLAREPDGDLYLFRGKGDGGWIPHTDGPVCGDGKLVSSGWQVFAWIVEPRDWGAGDCIDIMGDRSGFLDVYIGNCVEGFQPPHLIGIGSGWQDFDIMVGTGDFTGDGCPDFLSRKYQGSPDLYSYRGNCFGGFLENFGWGIGSGFWDYWVIF
jgi:hypothetical protein